MKKFIRKNLSLTSIAITVIWNTQFLLMLLIQRRRWGLSLFWMQRLCFCCHRLAGSRVCSSPPEKILSMKLEFYDSQEQMAATGDIRSNENAMHLKQNMCQSNGHILCKKIYNKNTNKQPNEMKTNDNNQKRTVHNNIQHTTHEDMLYVRTQDSRFYGFVDLILIHSSINTSHQPSLCLCFGVFCSSVVAVGSLVSIRYRSICEMKPVSFVLSKWIISLFCAKQHVKVECRRRYAWL